MKHKVRSARKGTTRRKASLRKTAAKPTRPPYRVEEIVLKSLAALEAHTEEEARAMLGVSAAEAFAMLDRGDLHGTGVEAELKMLRALRDGFAKKS